MAVSPTGAISGPLGNAKDILAACSAFQSWCGVANAAAAKAFIKMFWEDTDGLARPFCVVSPGDWRAELQSETGFGWDGRIVLLFEDTVTESDSDDAGYDFCNNLGGVYTDLQTKSADPTYMRIKELTVPGGRIKRSHRENASYYQGVIELGF